MKVCVYLPIWSDYGFNWKRLPNHGTLDQEPSTDFVFLCVRLAMPSGTQLSEEYRRILFCRRSWTWTIWSNMNQIIGWVWLFDRVGVPCRNKQIDTDRYSLLSQLLTTNIHMIHDKYVYMRNIYYSLHNLWIIHPFFSDDIFLMISWFTVGASQGPSVS